MTAQALTWSACPVCEAREAASYVSFPELEFGRCTTCGVVYKRSEQADIRPAEFYEKAYFHGRKSGRDKRFEHRVRKAMRQLAGPLRFIQARSLLDIGCSFGYIIEAGRRLGLESAGSDISQYAVGVCQERGFRAKVASLEQLPFETGEFDIVMMRHVLEHTPHPKQALQEVTRVLSPGGVVMVAVPDLHYWKGDYRRKTYRYFRPDDLGQQHYVYYSDDTLRQLLESSGFEVLSQSKAIFQETRAKKNPLWRLGESLRFGGVWAWTQTARMLRMRREIVCIARKRA